MSWPTGFLPVLPLRNTVLFPLVSQAIKVGRDRSLCAIEKSLEKGSWVLALTQKNPDLEGLSNDDFFTVGTLSKIESYKRLSDGSVSLVLRGHKRVEVANLSMSGDSHLQAQFRPQESSVDLDVTIEQGLMKSLLELSQNVLKPTEALLEAFQNIQELEEMGYFVLANTDIKVSDKQKALETLSIKDRTMEILKLLSDLKVTFEVQEDIKKKLYSRFGQNQREQILREQMKAIKEELGEKDGDASPEEYFKKIKDLNLPKEAKDLAEQQAKRLDQINSSSPEFHVIKNHLDFLLSMPWNKTSAAVGVDLEKAKVQLDADHFGLDKIKKRILQSLSVLKLTEGKRGSILLFVGPPGVGKTSLGQSIAKSLGRQFVRVSLGGVRDDAEIRGHRRTYVGALPGRILSSLKRAGEKDPVLLLDEVDKMGRGYSGDPASSLLEVLDPEQNKNFMDHYLDTAFDLSQVLFIATANSLEGIPGPLLDRMEVIELGSYTNLEKLEIAQTHLVPKVLKEHGLMPEQVIIPREILEKLVMNYTRESGVRELQRKITQICRFATEWVVTRQEKDSSQEPLVVTNEHLDEIMQGEHLFRDKEELHRGPGVVAGLAWTPVGGDLLYIESAKMPGQGKLSLTGKLGDVMRESAELALSLLKSRMAFWNVSFDFAKNDLHIHAPAGAIPKDGPSAGVTILTSLASLISGRLLGDDQAMTGEITLTGAVLPVGGIKEKLMAAHRHGRTRVLIPAGNERDLKQLPPEVRKDLNVFLAHHVDEVLAWALDMKSVEQGLLQSLDSGISGLTRPDL